MDGADCMNEIASPGRPVLRYHGGKWRLAPWILGFLPPHRIYVEPFAGGASILIRKQRSYSEVYNDLDGDVVNIFRILRDHVKAAELRRLIELTPFARDEFEAAYESPESDIERARAMLVRSFMGFGSASMTRTHITGFRKNTSRSGTVPATDWRNWPAEIPAFVERLRGVVIENRPAIDVVGDHDREDALFYVDPPYVWSTRSSLADRGRIGSKHAYRHEMTDEDHRALAARLHSLKGMVVLSGYPCELYDQHLYAGWERHERKHLADGAHPRLEVVWLNAACSAALRRSRAQRSLIA